MFNNILLATINPNQAIANIDGESADYYYSVRELGEYTLSVTLNGDTRTGTAVISTNDIYDFKVRFPFYFFKPNSGSQVAWSGYGSKRTVSNEKIVITSNGNDSPTIYPTQKQIFNKWDTIVIKMKNLTMSDAGYKYKYGVTITNSTTNNASRFYSATTGRVPDNAIFNKQWTLPARNVLTTFTVSYPKNMVQAWIGLAYYGGNSELYGFWLEDSTSSF